MTRPVRVSEEADAEITEEALWYGRVRPGLGAAFISEVDSVAARIGENPSIGGRVPLIAHDDVRRRFVRRFPYHLVYVELPYRVQILAIAHDRRRPRYWVGRLPT